MHYYTAFMSTLLLTMLNKQTLLPESFWATQLTHTSLDDIAQQQFNNSSMQKTHTESLPLKPVGLLFCNDIPYFNNCLYVSNSFPLQLLHDYHDSPSTGHSG